MPPPTLNAPGARDETTIRDWFNLKFKQKIRLRPRHVCAAFENFGFSDRRDDLRKLVESKRLTPLPKVNGEVKAHYHREDVIMFLVENCQPALNRHE